MGLEVVSNMELRKKAKSSYSVTSLSQNDSLIIHNSKSELAPPILWTGVPRQCNLALSSKNQTFNYVPKYGTRFVANTSVMNYMYLNKLKEDSILDSQEALEDNILKIQTALGKENKSANGSQRQLLNFESIEYTHGSQI